MPNFSANILYLFNEVDLVDRVNAAAKCGFKAIECQRPFNVPASTMRDLLAENQIEMVLINTPISLEWPNDSGIAIFPERVSAFQEITEIAINYAAQLGCPHLHVVAGHINENIDRQTAEGVFLSNIIWAADLGIENNIKILIEPLNKIDNPCYFLNTAAQAIDLLNRANHENLYLQYDLYHAGMNGEDIIHDAHQYLNKIAHMQMAGVPGRHEPNTGNIDMVTAFAAIDEMGYEGWIGAEYTPTKSTLDSLYWGNDYGIGQAPVNRR